MSLPYVNVVDTWRTRTAVHLANLALRLADERYRNFIRGSIERGIQAAIDDLTDTT